MAGHVDANDGEVPIGQDALILNNVAGMLLSTFLSQGTPKIALPRDVKAMVAASVERGFRPPWRGG